MLEDLKDSAKRTVGTKQTVKAIKKNMIDKVFIAKNADNYVVGPVIQLCEEMGVDVVFIESMKELGKACGIDVAAAAVGLLKE